MTKQETVFDMLKAGKTVVLNDTYYKWDNESQIMSTKKDLTLNWSNIVAKFSFFMEHAQEFREVKEPLTEEELVLALVRREKVENESGREIHLHDAPFVEYNREATCRRRFEQLGKVFKA